MKKSIEKVEVRMYRIGTGDCLLLKFFPKGKDHFTMMIDFGSCKGNKARFNEFAQEIGKFVNNRIDLLVITHEHLDHIIGFARGLEEFQEFSIGYVWVAWTEDPTNKLAKKLKKKYGKDIKALAAAVEKMRALSVANAQGQANNIGMARQRAFLTGLTESLSLYLDADLDALPAEAGLSESQRAMDYVLRQLEAKTGEPPFYCYPGKAVPKLPELPGVRFYVLGPPEDEDFLRQEEIKDDVYHRKFNADDDQAFMLALTEPAGSADTVLPFSRSYVCTDQQKQAIRQHFLEGQHAWRDIKMDWLHNAGRLAIRLERFMNNTSLVLAIELEESGKVLLFPGDAQSGNWRSWHDGNLRWIVNDNGTRRTVRAKDLLQRTVFYKVGHHLSHNGTASRSGLDLMDSNELIAFATLDYNNISSGWKNTMPSPGLLNELVRRSKGRVFRIDEGLIDRNGAKAARRKLTKSEKQKLKSLSSTTAHYIEYVIK